MNLMAASMDPRWRQSRTIPDPAPDGTKVDRDYKQAEQASPPWTRQDGPSCTTSVGPGVTPPQCSPRPSRQRRDAATCAATYGQTGPCYFSRCFVQSNLIYLKIDEEEGGRGKRMFRAFPNGDMAPTKKSSRLPFSPPSFPSPKKAKDQGSGREQAIWARAGTAWPPHALCPSSVRSQVPAWPLGLVAGLLCAWLGPSGAQDLIGCIAVGLITRPPHSRTNNNSDNHKSDNLFSGIFGWKK